MSKEFPPDLVKAYIACKKSDWADDKYDAFKKQAAKYLKSYAEDKLEHCKLVVDLTRATSDLFKGNQNGKEEKGAKKGKTAKKLTRRRRTLSKLSGSDKGQEEGASTEKVPSQD